MSLISLPTSTIPENKCQYGYELSPLNLGLSMDSWDFFCDDKVQKIFAADFYCVEDELKGNYIEGSLIKNNTVHCVFEINSTRAEIYFSDFFRANYDIVISLVGKQIIASAKIFK
ncbi:hypothetical protein M3172_16100 [Mesobacillus subterraneus]|uniref:hypothetical protein n=1 Tax=Mesobacillus subterraneus TaxID=285983 RepID=UPI002040804D|nr:hypothetical protein [Mesobacillus subterraneus]MCM3574720.1 hypothetical protein [Mesobacillus subterraneus]